MVKAYCYDAEGRDREVEVTPAMLTHDDRNRLLWFDLCRSDEPAMVAAAELLGLPAAVLARGQQGSRLVTYDTHFQLSVPAPPIGNKSTGNRLDFLAADTWLMTIRDEDIQFLVDFRDQDRGETMKGALTPAVLAASLLDWHLESYFDAIAKVEAALDDLDDRVLASRADKDILGRLAAMRRRVAVLRAAIAEQRPVFHGLVRPDFAPVASEDGALDHYRALVARFDRAIDSVERAREGVVGSFDLFASKTGQETNDLVKALTFVTVVIGFAAAVAGIFGMNFETPFFKTGEHGFVIVLTGMAVSALAASVVARRRGWI